ncbi:hypothetical protein KEU06_09490 [Pseudaminobacter sp. 19-2017]|uniref:Uncharacterized protein n=1 Tax=Pseudaminobacter soli (ex Zhang et al. 2022) TaxID=2831468 RepID=A0A942DX55_9HYPH|nr:hypothetical protein [Pseudaminobacter soli]MBS3648838.1 hypothetical protein [Pseudaminobacter soli]
MKASKLIKLLEEEIKRHGDLEIVGGYISDDRPPRRIAPVTDFGYEPKPGEKASGFFLES